MRKIIFLSILIFVALANAQIYLDKVECTAEGNPQNSCTISFSRFSFGQNFNVEGTNMFFFDVPDFMVSKTALPQSANVPKNSKVPALPIRFFISSSNPGYNSAMSLIHTAYSTRATVKVIFMNPISNLLKDDQAYGANYKSQYCYVNRVNKEPFSILCPIMAITLSEN